MEFWNLLGQSKFEGVTLFWNVNLTGVYTVLLTVAHSKWPVEHAYTWFTYANLKDMRQSLGTNGEEEYNIVKISAFYETAKFTGNQSDLLGKLK